MIDLIFEYNTNPNRQKLEYGIPSSFPDDFWGDKCSQNDYTLCPGTAASDHRPYRVKVKIK